MMSWTLQWLVGLQRLGHEVFFAEKSDYHDSCYDPSRRLTSDDFAYGLRTAVNVLERFGFAERWCYADAKGGYHGLSRARIEEAFDSADVYLDLGNHGAWLEEATRAKTKVLVDGEPGYTQMRMEASLVDGQPLDAYDHYFTNGANIGTASTAPTAGLRWHHVFNPVVTDLFAVKPPRPEAPYSTVMNWESHAPFEYKGRRYGQKDIEFARFMELPQKTGVPLLVAISGADVPSRTLEAVGWKLCDAQQVTISLEEYQTFLLRSRGEFSVAKNVFVATHSGWFSDRSAAYLASGRPVVLQETGFSSHLPTGEGLFAVENVEAATEALERIEEDYDRHAAAARSLACEHLEASKVLPIFLDAIGI